MDMNTQAAGLLQSKKAKSTWIGVTVTTIVGVGLWKLGVPTEYAQFILGTIASLFGVQIAGQALQDHAIASQAVPAVPVPAIVPAAPAVQAGTGVGTGAQTGTETK